MNHGATASIITAVNLAKSFGDFAAVNGISFTVYRGECFGLLGPNGAGKTSIVKMVYGFSPVSSGTLTVFGLDVQTQARAIKARLGVVAQDDNLDPELTVLENLLVYASYFGLERSAAKQRAAEILEFMELTEKMGAVVEHLSGGMKRRLTIGRALINQPELLILDEPTTGLDPLARHLVWQRLRKLKDNGATLLLTTHYLEEASQLCDRLIILNHGSILEEGAPDALIARHVGKDALELGIEPRWHNPVLGWSQRLLKSYQTIGDDLILFTDHGQALAETLSTRLAALQLRLNYQRLRPTNLEDVFLKLTGETLDIAGKQEHAAGNWQDY